MRRPSERQSALRSPLNYLLGTEANVRLLRVLSEAPMPLGKAEVARRAGLNESGVRRALSTLEKLGIVEPLGAGPQKPVQLRRRHPLSAALESLFDVERGRFERLIESLRGAAEQLRPAPKSAWLQGPIARGSDQPGDPLVAGLLTTVPDVETSVERLDASITELMDAHDVLVEVRGWTEADLATAPQGKMGELEHVITLAGPPPLSFLPGRLTRTRAARPRRTHADLEERNLALAGAIAHRLAEDPSQVDRAREYIAHRTPKASPGERKELREWDRLLKTMSVARVRRFLVDRGERATRLRQTLPFVEALSDQERKRVLEEAGR